MKKEAKTFIPWYARRPHGLALSVKSFLVLFFKKELLAFAFLFVFGLWLAWSTPAVLLDGTYDDLLFAREANAILDGHWLGAFDHLTLSKGCVYPLFLAAMAWLHVPVLVATQAVYLTGSLVLSRVLASVTGWRPGGVVCFAMLALSPVMLDGSDSVLMREPLYAGLTMLVIGLAARVLLCGAGVFWCLALGLVLAAFWMTREEGVWLVPALAILGAGAGFRWRMAVRVGVAAGVFGVCVLGVCAVNFAAYGVFRPNDFQYGPFPDAYGALSRVEHDRWQRLIPVPVDVREKAYAASPAARELRPFMEGTSGRGWMRVGCESNPIPECTDIQSGWFMWALRDAATQAGQYRSAVQAEAFYRRLAGEIDGACDSGVLVCLPARSGYLPPLRHIDFGLVGADLWRIAGSFGALGPAVPYALPSLAQGAEAALYRRILPGTKASASFSFENYPGWHVEGTVSGNATVAVVPQPGGLVRSSIPTGSSGFSGDVRCAPGACRLQVMRGDRVLGGWLLASLKQGVLLESPGLRVTLGKSVALPISATVTRISLQTRVAGVLSWLATPFCRVAFPVALIWVVWRCIEGVRSRRVVPVTVLAVSLTVAIVTRIAFLALLDATSIPLLFRYEMPGLVLVPALIACMLADVAGRWVRRA